MDDINILPRFHGILCHDHWKPYYRYTFTHALCNAHHLRELTRAYEQDHQQWADDMEQWLRAINRMVDQAGGALDDAEAEAIRHRYRALLKQAEIECPPPRPPTGKTQTGTIETQQGKKLAGTLEGL